ncbi:hypothetical protein [Trinickia dabaoshanensis]|uniref:hypothetical protein n=1 Tax=Trinickia dabaoshanensis TaxID=564714 RepID=UPI0018EB0271|nr:hypothetical protein [Trinickia dabaoshanensis]
MGNINDQFGMGSVVTAGGLVGVNRGTIEYSSSAANMASGTVGDVTTAQMSQPSSFAR